MRRVFLVVMVALTTATLAVSAARAGNPHFVVVTVTRTGGSLVASGKIAGLGNELQVHVVVSATASCINRGNNHPQAENKESFSAQGDFPVQNGNADFTLTLTPAFQPECSPPMTVTFTDVSVTDTTHNISRTFPGPF